MASKSNTWNGWTLERVLDVVEEVRVAAALDPLATAGPPGRAGSRFASVNSRRCAGSRTYRFSTAS